jgi:hypothetical protein
MSVAADDWRRAGQEKYLRGARLTWKRYQALRGDWEHEHCAFCWQKFLDAHYSEWARSELADKPQENDASGYTTVGGAGQEPAGEHWICKQCFEDFVEEFAWTTIESDPDAWPYSTPEPNPRPTARDYNPDA